MVNSLYLFIKLFREHAKELGNAVPSGGEKPLLFMKPSSSIVTQGQNIEVSCNSFRHDM